MTRVAFICLGAYYIESWSKEKNFDRQSGYSMALEQALNLSLHESEEKRGVNSDFFIVENTVSNEGQIIDELKNQFSNPLIKDVQYINNNNLGAKNKGAGEYVMCRSVIEKHKDELGTYDWIIYYTLRQTIITPIILESIRNSDNTSNIIVGNPNYYNLDGHITLSAPGNYCDMIFAMRPEIFFRYIDSMSPEELTRKNMSSEKNLFNFIKNETKESPGSCIEVKHLGVMRYDYAVNKTQII